MTDQGREMPRLFPTEVPVPTRTRREPTRRSGGPPVTTMPLLDFDELSSWLNTSVRHLRRLVDEDRIPYHKVGRFVRFDVNEIQAWLDENARSPESGRG
jgi:excisionase family DNA binding protein